METSAAPSEAAPASASLVASQVLSVRKARRVWSVVLILEWYIDFK